MSVLRKIQRVGKRATKFQYTATYQSVVVESLRDKWRPNKICVSWTRKGRRLITKLRPWQQSPDNNARGVVIWPEPEIMDITVTLYKGPKDKTYETKEWEFAVIDVDSSGKRKVLATTSINMVRYASSMPYDHDLHLRLKPTSRKIKTVMLEVSLTSKFLKEGKATDDDMISLASMMSVSNLSTIGFLEDEEDDYSYWGGGRSITPPTVPQEVLSTDQLLKWSQEVTADVPSVKITNMTTSWRSGLGFLAIIRYYRPDLIQDFEMLSPNTLKDNNILAFDIARSLGIACTLTPNMMVTATVPDKLAVMSFVYQMYQYFNKATQSAITRQSSRNVGSGANSPTGEESRKSPSSPFDITKFEVFATKDSPVTTTPPDANKVSMYSRHSRDNSQTEIQLQQQTKENVPQSISPILAQQAGLQVQATEQPNHNEPYSHQDQTTGNASTTTSDGATPVHHSAPEAVSNDDTQGEERDNSNTVSPKTSAKLKLDELVSDHAYLIQPEEDNHVTDEKEETSDRALEFENLKDTDESSSELPTSSTVSLLDDDDSRIPDLPLDDKPSTEHQSEPSQISPRRRLPTIPAEAAVSTEDLKREERRRRAKEMLKKHRIDALKIPSNLSGSSGPSSTKSKYREEAINMLGKVFGTPETGRRVRVPRNEDDDLTSGDSATSFGPADEDSGGAGSKQFTRPRSATAAASLQRSAKSDTNVKSSRAEVKKEVKTTELAPTAGRSRARSFDSGSSKPQEQESGSVDTAPQSTHTETRPTTIDLSSNPAPSDKRQLEKRLSDSQLEAGRERRSRRTPTSPQGGQKANVDDKGRARDLSQSEGGGNLRTSVNRATSPSKSGGGGSTAGNRQKKRPAKALPAPRPVSAKPSAVLKNLVEQKKEEADLEATTAAQQSQTDGAEMSGAADLATEDTVETSHLQNGSIKGEQSSSDKTEAIKQSPSKLEGSPSKKKTLPSPAWSEHDSELSKDILVTQSEYVKGELIHLRQNLQNLEDRAGNIETDIRNAMSEGDREQEENLMQEWFGILNKKNELIKRQMELNFIEMEEDLEKRQFFINRELRPLMEIPEDDKTTTQKDREAQLLRELIELIDERDTLERKRISTERNAYHERYSLATVQGETANNVQATTQHSSSRQSSKDCVIQ